MSKAILAGVTALVGSVMIAAAVWGWSAYQANQQRNDLSFALNQDRAAFVSSMEVLNASRTLSPEDFYTSVARSTEDRDKLITDIRTLAWLPGATSEAIIKMLTAENETLRSRRNEVQCYVRFTALDKDLDNLHAEFKRHNDEEKRAIAQENVDAMDMSGAASQVSLDTERALIPEAGAAHKAALESTQTFIMETVFLLATNQSAESECARESIVLKPFPEGFRSGKYLTPFERKAVKGLTK